MSVSEDRISLACTLSKAISMKNIWWGPIYHDQKILFPILGCFRYYEWNQETLAYEWWRGFHWMRWINLSEALGYLALTTDTEYWRNYKKKIDFTFACSWIFKTYRQCKNIIFDFLITTLLIINLNNLKLSIYV